MHPTTVSTMGIFITIPMGLCIMDLLAGAPSMHVTLADTRWQHLIVVVILVPEQIIMQTNGDVTTEVAPLHHILMRLTDTPVASRNTSVLLTL